MNYSTDITGILVSAGLSSRMGEFKPLMKLNGIPFVVLIAGKMLNVCGRLVIVTGFRSEEISETVGLYTENNYLDTERISIVENSGYETGMFTSLKAGLAAASRAGWYLYHFVDQPSIPENFYPEFIAEIDDNYDWIQPSFNNIKGHPILLGPRTASGIREMSQDSSLKTVAAGPSIRKLVWDCPYRQILYDMDTKEDLNLLHL